LRPASRSFSGIAEKEARQVVELFENLFTRSGQNAFRIVVAKAGEASLFVFRGVPDQDFEPGRIVSFRIPADAFVHTSERAVVTLRATLLDGRPLPKWLRFDPSTGEFDGKPPAGAPRLLSVLVLAKDSEGREASTIFRIRFDRTEARRESGRAGLSERLRMAADRGPGLERHLRDVAVK
jgi:hypothetical protein